MQHFVGLQGHAQMPAVCKAAVQRPDGVRTHKGSPRKSTDVLVVCHERCYKADFMEQTRWLIKKSKQYQGRTLRFKKVTGFQEWASEHGDQPYMLIIGWREAKPCSEVIQCCPPANIFLLADKCKASIPRAKDWAVQHGATLLSSLNDITEEVLTVPKPLPLTPAVTPSYGLFEEEDDLMCGDYGDDWHMMFHGDLVNPMGFPLYTHDFEQQTSEPFGWMTLHL
eukprot:TRINITY_DN6773_c0_g1_i1.p1 TRINITY_DN6773_c0_g1~~TRINITY_DN6773_c0_g1_i1.p1  ORF type:complete len:254 (-),score=22.75 TRINITY_DN6773_c0_g1_i1:93-764(-)